MKTSLLTVYKIEMFKFFKRKDWLSLLALVAIGIMFGVAVITDGYSGESNQSALYWVCTQVFNSCVLIIAPLISAYTSVRIMASELENGSILLYTIRIRNRRTLYIGKSLAVLSFATISFVFTCIVNFATYYVLAVKNQSIASGSFSGENTAVLFLTLIALYLISFVLASQFSLFLSTFFKSQHVIGIVFLITLIARNTYKLPYVQNFNLWYKVLQIGLSPISSTDKVLTDISGSAVLLVQLFAISIILIALFNIASIKRLKEYDLS